MNEVVRLFGFVIVVVWCKVFVLFGMSILVYCGGFCSAVWVVCGGVDSILVVGCVVVGFVVLLCGFGFWLWGYYICILYDFEVGVFVLFCYE